MFRRVLLLAIPALLHGHEPGHYLFSAEHAIPLLLAAGAVIVLIGRKVWLAQRK